MGRSERNAVNYSTKETKTMVEWLRKTGYKESAWEHDFLESVLKWRGGLTSKQSELLYKIYQKATEKE